MIEQQDSGKSELAPVEVAPGDAVRSLPDAGDSTWGQGAAAAMDNLRRHHFGARQSQPPEEDRPSA